MSDRLQEENRLTGIDSGYFPGFPGWGGKAIAAATLRVPRDRIRERQGLLLHVDSKNKHVWYDAWDQLTDLKYLRVTSRMNKELFVKICERTSLTHLEIERSSVADWTQITSLKDLKYLQIGSTPKLESLSPITDLKKLVSFGLVGSFPQIDHLRDLTEIRNLRGLLISGLDRTKASYDSIDPIAELVELRYLGLGNVDIDHGSLRDLGILSKLEYLQIDPMSLRRWPLSDYIYLKERLRNIKGDLLNIVITDKELQVRYGIK